MNEKQYKLSADEIKLLVFGKGACFASDRITVDGEPVGYCYREATKIEGDSGWRFLAGDEDEAYMQDADHLGMYDVNTIANYDPSIIDLLEAGVGAEFARDDEGLFFPLDEEDD